MTYSKTIWVDEVLAGAERFDVKDNVGVSIHDNVQIALRTTVTTPGTSINAANLNKIENGIYDLSRGAGLSVKGIVGNAAGDIADIAAGNDNEVLRRSGTTLGFGKVANAGLVDRGELIYLKVWWHDEAWVLGNGALYFTVPPYLHNGVIADFDIACITASSSGLPTVQMKNLGANPLNAGTNVLSTAATIDVNEFNSMNAATQPVIGSGLLASGDILRVDITAIGTGTKGLDVFFRVDKA